MSFVRPRFRLTTVILLFIALVLRARRCYAHLYGLKRQQAIWL